MYPLLSSICFIFTMYIAQPSYRDLDFKYKKKHHSPITYITLPLLPHFCCFFLLFCWTSCCPLLSPSQIIYIRFVLCRLRSHADEGLWSLQGLGALPVSFVKISLSLRAFTALLHFLLCRSIWNRHWSGVWTTSTTQLWERKWKYRDESKCLVRIWNATSLTPFLASFLFLEFTAHSSEASP